jgi:NitT/TauT family transport system permease protein
MAIFPRQVTPIVLATLTVYFTMFLSASVGFASTPPAREALLTTLGSSALKRFWRVQFPSAVPTLLAGLKFAAPTAFLGAILGEWFGTESGIGPIIVIAMQNFRIELLWAAALVITVTSMIVYGLLSVGERVAGDRYG